MSNYRRIYVQGGIYFFTVVLENRKSDLLCRYINEFRQAYAETCLFYSRTLVISKRSFKVTPLTSPTYTRNRCRNIS